MNTTTDLLTKEMVWLSAVTYAAARERTAKTLYNMFTILRLVGRRSSEVTVGSGRLWPHLQKRVRVLYLSAIKARMQPKRPRITNMSSRL